MRWLFLLLMVLNIFYFIWHHQAAPLRVKEVASLSAYKGSKQGIQLINEVDAAKLSVDGECLYLRGSEAEGVDKETLLKLMEKELQVEQVGDGGLFRVIGPPTVLRGEQKLLNLMNEFKYLRFEKKPC